MSDVNTSIPPRSTSNFRKIRYNKRSGYKIKSHLETIKYFIAAFRPSEIIMLSRDEYIEYAGVTAGFTIGILSIIYLTNIFSTSKWVATLFFVGAIEVTPLGILITLIAIGLVVYSLWQILKDHPYSSPFADIDNVSNINTSNTSWYPIYNTPTHSDISTYKYREIVVVTLFDDAETYADSNFTYNETDMRYILTDNLNLKNEVVGRDSYNVGNGDITMMRMLALTKGSEVNVSNHWYYAGLEVTGINEYGDDKVTNELHSVLGYKLFMSFYMPELTPYIKIKNVSLTGRYSGINNSTTQSTNSIPDLEVGVEDFRFNAGIKKTWIYNAASSITFVPTDFYNTIDSFYGTRPSALSAYSGQLSLKNNIENPLFDTFDFYDYYTGYTSLSHNTVPEIDYPDVAMSNSNIHSISSYPIWMGRMERSGKYLTFKQDDYIDNYEYRKRHQEFQQVPLHASIWGYDNILKVALGAIAANSETGIKRLKLVFGINPLLNYDDNTFINNYDNDSSPLKWYKNGPYWTPYESRISRYNFSKYDIKAFRFGYEFDYSPYLEASVDINSIFFTGSLNQTDSNLWGLTFRVKNKGSKSTISPVSIRILSYIPPAAISSYYYDPIDYLTFHSSSELANSLYYVSRMIPNLKDDVYRLDYGSYEVLYEISTVLDVGDEWSLDGYYVDFKRTDGKAPTAGQRHIILQVDNELEIEEHRWIQGMDATVNSVNLFPYGPRSTDTGLTEVPTISIKNGSGQVIASKQAGVDDIGRYKAQNYAGTYIITVNKTKDFYVYNLTLDTTGDIFYNQSNIQFSYNYRNNGETVIPTGSILIEHFISPTSNPSDSGSVHFASLDYNNPVDLVYNTEHNSPTILIDIPQSLHARTTLYFIVRGTEISTSDDTNITNNQASVSFNIIYKINPRIFFID